MTFGEVLPYRLNMPRTAERTLLVASDFTESVALFTISPKKLDSSEFWLVPEFVVATLFWPVPGMY